MQKIKESVQHSIAKIKKKVKGIQNRWQQEVDHFHQDYEGTEPAVSIVSILLFVLMAGALGKDVWKPKAPAFIVTVIAAFVGVFIFEWVFRFLIRLAGRCGSRGIYRRMLLLVVLAVLLLPDMAWEGMGAIAAMLLLAGLLVSMLVFLRSLAAIFLKHVWTARTVVPLAVSSIIMFFWMGLLLSPGLPDETIAYRNALALEKREALSPDHALSEQEVEAFQESFQKGGYTVEQIDYGTGGESLDSGTADIHPFAENEGLGGWIKEAYQGYGLTKVPLTGRIWYPSERRNCETIFLAHGNHVYTEDSYLGYSYLGEYLASYGYVVVSVDENACNWLSDENDARAVLLLENIKQVEAYNEQEGGSLFHRMNFQKLALAGHSRGGEMIADAYLFNQSDSYPDDGTIKFDYHFSIQSLFAIAPTVNQYMPSDRDVELFDVNYFVLYGTNDQDVVDFMGMRQYHHIKFSGQGRYFKGAVAAAGMNHGQFNERWGKYDLIEPLNRVLHVKNFLKEEEQQTVARIFAKVFFDITLKEEREQQALLTDVRRYQDCLPPTSYTQSYQASAFVPIADFEEDMKLNTGTMAGSRIAVSYVGSFKEKLLYMPGGDSLETHVLSFRWGGKKPEEKRAEVEICLPAEAAGYSGAEVAEKRAEQKKNLSSAILSFDIMDQEEYTIKERPKLLEASISLQDQKGETAALLLSDYANVYPDLPIYLNKFSQLFHLKEYEHNMQTVRLPLSDFLDKNPELDIEEVVQINFQFPGDRGFVALDNLGLELTQASGGRSE